MKLIRKLLNGRALRALGVVSAFAMFASGFAHAQAAFPRQPIRLVVPYPTGAGIDTVARQLAEPLAHQLGQPVIVDNRGGANGGIGMEYAAKAPADGYTIVLALDAQYAINPNVYKSLPYDPIKDFTPIMLIGSVSYVLVTSPQSGIKSAADIIDRARKPDQRMNYTGSGVGSGGHMAGALLESLGRVTMTHIPNKSTPSALRDVAEGEVQFVFVTYGACKPLIDAGKLIPIGVSGPKRMAVLPNVPTVAESVPGFETVASYGLFVTAGTPPRAVENLHAAMGQVMAMPAYQQKLAAIGIEPIGIGPQAFAAHITKDLAKWKAIVTEKGITVN